MKTDREVAGLEQVRAKLTAWRGQRSKGERIPEAVWGRAVTAVHRYGLNRVSRALRLDYYSLKRRLADHTVPAIPASATLDSSAFVELPASTFSTSGECLIELEKSSGEKIRIRWKGAAPDVVALNRSFWSAE